ncbi:KxYKxGKxW signal peptide domain-containing protein [Limosilactobacillus antri]|uniref:KxYKxGKxW signal domain protein n=1 Tax=Limosilactobacillus antri DSM 16041 TaxID=525309 RepID=C8P9U3_9LACO|nr:KxYKxGKxW signal peptide domain-containing protein [Limosilactobacillus antri]EEW52740.1 KxYKxGKxW signal domain protein [Limosilactobacillus antri DSM 16041]KRK55303.1 hypothetical protein FC31_GL001578 [Limosilactobacillus antri DSM 16041]
MKERKKIYKAGKLWVTATLVAFAGFLLTTTSAAADSSSAPVVSQTRAVDNPSAVVTPAPTASGDDLEGTGAPAAVTASRLAGSSSAAVPANQVLPQTTSKINGPTHLAANLVQNPRNFTVGVYDAETLVYTYHPQLGDLQVTDQNGQVVAQPTTAGDYQIRLSSRGLVNMQNDPNLQGYILQTQVSQPIRLYQPYTPNTQDYQENYGNLDGYSLRQTSATEAAVHVAGWHVSGASSLMPYGWLIVFDNTRGHEITRVAINPVNRPDVQAAYRNVYGSLQSGFDQDILIPLAAAGDDLTIIARYSSDFISGEGQRIDHWFSRINADHGNHAWIDSVQYVNGHFRVNGWHATNQALGKNYHTLIVWDASQGRELTRIANLAPVARPDLVKAYPTILGADRAGFSVDVPLLPVMVTDNIQFISRYSSTADSNRDYVDYWFAPQQLLSDHRNQGYLDNVSVQNGKLHIAGWHATNQAIGRPYHTLIILNAQTGRELVRYTTSQLTSRPDLTRAFPGIVTAGQAGFNVDLQLVPEMGDQPIRVISRWSTGRDANHDYVDYWFAPEMLVRDTTNRANLDGLTVVGNTVRAAGWHATGRSLGRPYHYVILFDQTTGREVARTEVAADKSARPDVARAFPAVYNAGQAGFNVQFKVQPALNGHRLAVLSRWTDDPAGNGNAVDYWFDQTVTQNVPVDKAKQL